MTFEENTKQEIKKIELQLEQLRIRKSELLRELVELNVI